MLAAETELSAHPFRGAKRFTVAVLTLILMLAICWTIWAWITARRVRTRIDAIVARHEPIRDEDFVQLAVSDDQNSVPLWNAAFNALGAIKVDCPRNSNETFYPLSPPWLAMEKTAVTAQAAVLPLARQASTIHTADWKLSGSANYTAFNHCRALANALADAADYAHSQGDDHEALLRLNDLLRLADSTEAANTMVSRLIAIGIQALGIEAVEMMTDIKVDDRTRPLIVSLIAELLDERDAVNQRLRFVYDDRREGISPALATYRRMFTVLRPMVDATEARFLDIRNIDVVASRQPDAVLTEAVYKTAPEILAWQSIGNSGLSIDFSRIVDLGFLPMNRYLDTEWIVKSERRAVAIALAIQLYRADHHRWPDQLPDLVPAYLPAIPTDPYTAGDKPIGYTIRKNGRPDEADRPMLYFAVPGDPESMKVPPTPFYGWNSQRDVAGQWRDLTLFFPPPPPPPPPPSSSGFRPRRKRN